MPASQAGFGSQESKLIYRDLVSGRFTPAQAEQVLALDDPQALVNVLHALGAHGAQRHSARLLLDLWHDARDKYPGLAWAQFSTPPVRVALAAALIRADPVNAAHYADYARQFMHGEQTVLTVAQAAVALAFNGRAEDVPLIAAAAASTHPYVAQSSISALALMNKPEARDALIKLQEDFAKDARAPLIKQVLRQAYDWPPRQRLAPQP